MYSKEMLLDGERVQFEVFLKGFVEQFRPVGVFEQSLVEILAILMLKRRRSLIAESAQIQLSTQFSWWDQQLKDEQELREVLGAQKMDSQDKITVLGLLHKAANPLIRQACMKLLIEIQERAQKNGFDPDRDATALTTLYGEPREFWRKYLKESQLAADQTERGVPLLFPRGAEDLLKGLEDEIGRLAFGSVQQHKIEGARADLRRLSLGVPESPDLERFMRNWTHLSREIDRTLDQLERAQRMRRGQPAPPALNVNITS
jgi:hypothetical protein